MTSIEPSGAEPKPGDLVEVTYRGTISSLSPVFWIKPENDNGGTRSVPPSASVTVLRPLPPFYTNSATETRHTDRAAGPDGRPLRLSSDGTFWVAGSGLPVSPPQSGTLRLLERDGRVFNGDPS